MFDYRIFRVQDGKILLHRLFSSRYMGAGGFLPEAGAHHHHEESSNHSSEEEIRRSNVFGKRPALKSWPEVVGLTGEEAKMSIKEENPWLEIHIIGPGQAMIQNIRRDRVWIHVDYKGKVICTPRIG